MTAIKYVVMVCDICGKHEPTDKTFIKMARADANALGWVFHWDRDYCKQCADSSGYPSTRSTQRETP